MMQDLWVPPGRTLPVRNPRTASSRRQLFYPGFTEVTKSTRTAHSKLVQLNIDAPPFEPREPEGASGVHVETSSGCKTGTAATTANEKDVPSDVVAGIRSLLRRHPEGLNIKLLPKLYVSEVEQHPYFGSRNWNQVDLAGEIISCIPRVSVSCDTEGDLVLKIVKDLTGDDEEHKLSGLPADVASAVERLLLRHPQGILVQDLVELYEAEYGPHTYFSGDNCNPMNLTLAVVSSSPCVTANTLSDRRCLLKIKVTSPSSELEGDYSSSTLIESDTTEEEMGTYHMQPLPTTQGFPVKIGEVYSPDAFYILIDGESTTEALSKLTADMDNFYSTMPSYTLSTKDITAGFPCAVQYVTEGTPSWLRAEVLSEGKNNVIISCVDYGAVAQVERQQLRQICPRFMELPIQGIKAGLAGIAPRGSMNWTHDAILHFLSLVKYPHLRCKIVDQNSEGVKVSLWKTDEEHSVEDVLIENGYADDLRQPSRDPEWVIKRCGNLDVIIWKGMPYVTGRNISKLFHWRPRAVEEMLAQKQIIFSVSTVSRSGHPALVADIEKCSGATDDSVTLFRLQNLPDLLNLFNHTSRDTRRQVEHICSNLHNFELLADRRLPSSPFSLSGSGDTTGDEVCTALQARRKALQHMRTYSGDSSECMSTLSSFRQSRVVIGGRKGSLFRHDEATRWTTLDGNLFSYFYNCSVSGLEWLSDDCGSKSPLERS
ncbi:uncharacterized protein LOC135396142 [Ornithodoros turicata]|uniref:uncharacterized protein LOC135396142 n=1 Tax=Ornithodoros turicata TaxID=34597 RepID=UPI00313914D5